MKRVCLLCLLMAFITAVKAQITVTCSKNDIDTFVNTAALNYMKDPQRVGLSIGVYVNGKRHTYHYGYKDKETRQRPTDHSLYEIGSITKTFTGVLLAQATVDKKLSLNDDIRNYLDGDYSNLKYEGQPIRIYQLINHTSGLPFLLPDKKELFQISADSIPYFVTAMLTNYSKEQFFRDLHNVQLDTVPGVKFSYSNSGAQLLGYILEKIYRSSFENLILKFITGPQKMPYTKLSYSKKEALMVAKGYNDKGVQMPYNPPVIGAAGNIKSTVTDMLNYVQFHLDETKPVVTLSHAPTFGNINSFAIGLNWQMNKTEDGFRRIWQSGGSFGFAGYCVVYPELNIGIVLLSNETDRTAQNGLGEIAEKIVRMIRGMK